MGASEKHAAAYHDGASEPRGAGDEADALARGRERLAVNRLGLSLVREMDADLLVIRALVGEVEKLQAEAWEHENRGDAGYDMARRSQAGMVEAIRGRSALEFGVGKLLDELSNAGAADVRRRFVVRRLRAILRQGAAK